MDDEGRATSWNVSSARKRERLDQAVNEEPGQALAEILERIAAERETFTPVTLCDCGRRYRAIREPPWIRKVDDAE